ncbi:hypothetical protein GO496_12060 [Acidovorax citrulli]|nr:hypothetical protein [Paracidovorax citrulli]
MHWIALPSRQDELPPGMPAAAAGWWALRFTPRVALLDEAVLLEVSCTERLWGGRDLLLTVLRQGTWSLSTFGSAWSTGRRRPGPGRRTSLCG